MHECMLFSRQLSNRHTAATKHAHCAIHWVSASQCVIAAGEAAADLEARQAWEWICPDPLGETVLQVHLGRQGQPTVMMHLTMTARQMRQQLQVALLSSADQMVPARQGSHCW